MKASDVTVQDFIGGIKKAFIVPPYQRNYAWGTENCLELYNDIMTGIETGRSHYIGNVVYYLGDNSGGAFQEMILVDGQQRITTILLFLCALRDITDNEDLKDDINEQYLCNKRANEVYRIRLKQTISDGEIFAAVIDGIDTQDKKNNVVRNYYFFKKQLLACKHKHTAILDAVARMQIVDVNLQISPDTKNRLHLVQTVFEKINSTGVRLSQADLIRNFLLISESDEKQQKWHKDYWLPIEKRLGVDYISAFTRDFLRMINCEEIRESDTYREFKDYLINVMNGDQELVLKTLLRFSKSYAWIVNLSCPDDKLNREFTMLRNLKSNDFAPLILFLSDKLYENSITELRRIIRLITDYVLRMRIASPGTGSGPTRSLTFEIIRKMRDDGEDAIDCTYDTLLFELSNSPSVAGEYPSDEKFISALQTPFYHIYARELLLRIEEHEAPFNIPVDISKVTVEHLMPQTLSDWWKQYLGGSEEAERIRIAYTNTVGNFAIVSQGYNSSMSNKPWDIKRESLRKVQFNVTNQAVNEEQWNEAAIIRRGADLARRAATATTSPLLRTRDYRSRMVSETASGIYPLLPSDDSLNGTTIHAVIFNDERNECRTWSRLLSVVSNFLYTENPALFSELIKDNGWFNADKSRLNKPIQISGSSWYCNGGGLGGRQYRDIAAKLAENMGLIENFSLEITGVVSEE